MGDEEKKIFFQQSEEDKKRYEKQVEEWLKSQIDEVPEPSSRSSSGSESSSSQSQEAPPRKKRKKRDPKMPKRPLNSFMCYMKAVRNEFKTNHPDKTMTEVRKIIGTTWKELQDNQKAPYQKIAEGLKSEYLKALSIYKRGKMQEENSNAPKQTAISEPKDKNNPVSLLETDKNEQQRTENGGQDKSTNHEEKHRGPRQDNSINEFMNEATSKYGDNSRKLLESSKGWRAELQHIKSPFFIIDPPLVPKPAATREN